MRTSLVYKTLHIVSDFFHKKKEGQEHCHILEEDVEVLKICDYIKETDTSR